MGRVRPGRRRITPRSLREWGAVAPQWLGILGLVACLVNYLLTRQANAAILTAFAGLIVVGQGTEALAKIGAAPPTVGGTVKATDPEAPVGLEEDGT